jgi:hypothetical protein
MLSVAFKSAIRDSYRATVSLTCLPQVNLLQQLLAVLVPEVLLALRLLRRELGPFLLLSEKVDFVLQLDQQHLVVPLLREPLHHLPVLTVLPLQLAELALNALQPIAQLVAGVGDFEDVLLVLLKHFGVFSEDAFELFPELVEVLGADEVLFEEDELVLFLPRLVALAFSAWSSILLL